ncbi:MAG TPA: MFS transporter [Syntrophorhabdaceae bacterium]|nr:MFS transporter [Syntrophorhabdaceae bacterium]
MKKFDLKVLLILSLGHLVVDIYQGALPTILPFLKERLAISYAAAGIILMMANLTSSVLQPIFGYYSDRKTKAILLPVGLFCAGFGFSLLSLPIHYTFLLLFVALSGLGIASYHPEGYKTASFFTGEKPATGMSIFSVGGNIGFSLGPILAVCIITYLGFSWMPVIILPSLACTIIILAYRKAISIPVEEHAKVQASAHRAEPGTYLSLSLIIATVVVRSWTQMGLAAYIPFYYISHLKGDALFAGKLVSTYLICGAAGTLIGAPLADKWGHKFFLVISMALATITLPLIFVPFIERSYLIFVALGLQGMVLISTFSVTVVMAQKLLPHRLGIASGLMVGFAIGAGGIGVTLLGLVADRYGVPVALKSITVLPFIGFLLSLFLKYKE